MKRNKTVLYLPFKGHWFVFWGGDTEKLNAHHDVPNQKFAFDFDAINDKGRRYKEKGSKNEDYYSFGKKILAPADGLVVEAINGVRDNKPGSMNPSSALGNAVIIRHRRDEVSVLAHLKNGSIKVRVGNKVKAGQLIGFCGNSGNSSEPHLHYHLQNSEIIQEGVGIKCYFQNVTVIRKGQKELKTEHSSVKGEIVGSY